MEFRQLQYFVEVARQRHFRRAAERLLVSQPALSQQVRQLESELGHVLLDRAGRRVKLTAAGEAFLARAERILAEVEDAKAKMQEFSGLVRGRVVVGTLQTLAELRLPSLLTEFNRLYPGVEVALWEESEGQMMELLNRGDLDLALAHVTGISVPPGVVTERLFSEDLVLVVSPDHALADRERVELGELREESFILAKPDSGIRSMLLNACLAEGFAPHVAFETAALRSFAAQGLGITLIPRLRAESEGPAVKIAELASPMLSRTVAFFWVKNRYRSPAAGAFLKFFGERLQEDGAPESDT